MMRKKPVAGRSANSGISRARHGGRLRLLGSGSAIAAAIALTGALPSLAVAQSVSQRVMPPIFASDVLQSVPPQNATRGPASAQIAMEIHAEIGSAPFDTPVIPVFLAARPVPGKPAAQSTSALPDLRTPISGGNAIGIDPVGNAPVTGVIAPLSSTAAPSPGDTDTNGVNVLASANYFSADADFRPGAAVDVVELFVSEAIINWTTFTAGSAATDVTFLNAGGNLQFTSNLADYTVLNRVFTPGVDSAIRIDGGVTSTVLGGSATGGNVWFYSPGGIIIGGTGSFDVGSLVLTSSNLNAIDSGGSQLNFLGVAEPDTTVVIEPGAAINANQSGSYVAVVAPYVEQAGTVTVDGSVAYVGAEQAQLTINNGLFDISVGVGSADANGVLHSGTTTGAASQAVVNALGEVIDADARAIYMVAVPKNDAITMLVGGNVGYQPAAAAAVTSNGTIILSAGGDVAQSGTIDNPQITIGTDNAAAGGTIAIRNAAFTSSASIYASDTADLVQNSSNALTMGSDGREAYALDVEAGETLAFGISGFGAIAIDGNVSLAAGSADGVGGAITVDAQTIFFDPAIGDPVIPPPPGAGTVVIGGDLAIDASAAGLDDYDSARNNGGTGIGEAAVAGTINFAVSNNAIVTVAGDLVLDASAQGGRGDVRSGNATGGAINLAIDSGTLAVTGIATLDAGTQSAEIGKPLFGTLTAEGADGIGGEVTLNLAGGAFSANVLSIDASGRATGGANAAISQDNQGLAGSIEIDVTGGIHSFGDLAITASGAQATSFDGSLGRVVGGAGRGTVDITVDGIDSELAIARDLNIDVLTEGAIQDPAGTVVSLTAQNTGINGGILVGGNIFIDTSAADGSSVEPTIAGSISLLADGSTISFDNLDIDAAASPSGNPFFLVGDGRDFQGGDITLTASGGGTITGATASLSSRATGSDLTGGDGVGGDIALAADDGSIVLSGALFVGAAGQGGGGIDPNDTASVGLGQGGTITFSVSGLNGAMDLDLVSANTDGSIFFDSEGGPGGIPLGNGGNGVAGDVVFDIAGGTFEAGTLIVSAKGTGGEGGDISKIPDPSTPVKVVFLGDTPDVFNQNDFGLQSIASVGPSQAAIIPTGQVLAAVGAPGSGSGGSGGDGIGGTVNFNLTGGSATIVDLNVTADGIGGDGAAGDINAGTAAGDGGDGIGGTATFTADSGSLTVTNLLSVTARGNTSIDSGDGGTGLGVEGGAGGNAIGGNAIFNMTGNANISAGTVLISADAFGGQGGVGDEYFAPNAGGFVAGEAGGNAGSGTAGNAIFNNTSGNIAFGSLTASAVGQGGVGGESVGGGSGSATHAGGAGGAGIGGTATLNLNQGDLTNPTYSALATASGGEGGNGLDGGVGGDATGGTARINVNNVAVDLTTATLDTSAVGGAGGFALGEGGNGGAGGDAVGGSAIFDVNGAAGVLTSDNPIVMRADAIGGQGAVGADVFGMTSATLPGMGGAGGDAQAGLVQAIARDGAQADYRINGGVSARSTGGAGGGGGADFLNFVNNADGGAAGSATGGRVELLADNGGTFTLVDVGMPVILNSAAIGGEGGSGGAVSIGDEGVYGANGATFGGEIALIARGTGSSLILASGLEADARATGLQDTRNLSVGAEATGGTLSIDIDAGGTIQSNGPFVFNADAMGATGITDPGNATGGTANVVITDGTFASSSIVLNLTGTGTPGQADISGLVGDAGNGTGGAASITVGPAGTLDLQALTIAATGTGGQGADDGTNPTEGGGGAGQGGIAIFSLDGTIDNLVQVVVQADGVGGRAGNARDGGGGAMGGAATGGTVDFTAIGSGPLLTDLAALQIDVTALGGRGGQAGSGDSTVNAGLGGTGGNAMGGSATFAIEGAGATFAIDPALFQIRADATGGTGGGGGFNDFGGATGVGGTGGNGTGGDITVEAASGTTITLSGGFVLASNGTGGTGGTGGSAGLSSGGAGEIGGTGGTGIGGSPSLRAIGGTIQGGDLQLTAVGFGGAGGLGGDDGDSTFAPDGTGGDGVGGTPLMEVLEGSPGILTFDNVDLLANGSGGAGFAVGAAIGGLVTIRDLSIDPLGLITLGSLDVDATGVSSIAGGGFLMAGNSGPIAVTNNLAINSAGDIVFDFAGDGQVVVGGNVLLDTDGNITITHTDNSLPTLSFDVTGGFNAQADGSFSAGADSIVNSGGELLVFAGNNISADDLRAVPGIVLSAAGSVLLNDAIASGPQGLSNFSGIVIDAGFSNPAYDPDQTVTLTGQVLSYSDITIRAGGTARFAAGANVAADNALTVRTGDDIVITAGAALSSANNPTTLVDIFNPLGPGPSLSLLAGDIANLLAMPPTPIASISAAGTLNANSGAVILTGNAVDALSATILAGSVRADINDAPPNSAAPLSDNGLLSAGCFQGNVCLGSITADNVIAIGQSSNNDVVQLIIDGEAAGAQDILITTRADIVIGASGIATSLGADNLFSVTSTEGDVNLLNAAITSDVIGINAAGSLTGNGSLTSVNDIGISVGDSITAAAIVTGGELTQFGDVGGTPEGSYSVPGSLTVGTLEVGTGHINYTATGDIVLGQVNVPGTDIILQSPGTVSIDSSSTAANIDIAAATIGLGTIIAIGDIDLRAIGGDIVADHIEADGNFTAITDGDFTTGLNSIITGGDIVIIGDIVDLGNSSAGGLVDVLASQIDFVTLIAGTTLDLETTPVGAQGNPGTGNGTITGVDMTAGPGASSVTAFNAITISGISQIDGSLALVAANDITLGIVDAQGGDLTADAGMDIALNSAISTGLVDFLAGGSIAAAGDIAAGLAGIVLEATAGSITGGNLQTDGDVAIDAGTFVSFDNITLDTSSLDILAGGDVTLNNVNAALNIDVVNTGAATFGDFDAAGDVSVDAQNAVNGQSVDTAGNIALEGSSVALGLGLAGGAINLTSTATNGMIMAGALGAGPSITIDAGTGGFAGATLDSAGTIGIASGGDVVFTAADAVGAVTIIGDGDINAMSIASGQAVNVTIAGELAVGAVSADTAGAGTVDISAAQGIEIATLQGTQANLSAAQGVVTVDGMIDLTNTLQAAGEAIVLRTGGALSANVAATAGDITVEAGDDLDIQGASATGDIALTSDSGAAVIGGATSGNAVSVSAATDVTIDAPVAAVGALSVDAGNLLDVQADASGTVIDIRAGDIAIGAGAALGRSDQTDMISIATQGDAYLGGAGGNGAPFELDNDEFSRIFSQGDISLSAEGPNTGDGNMTVGTLDVIVGAGNGMPTDGNIGQDGGLFLNAGNDVAIVGNVTIGNATSDNLLAIDAINAVTIATVDGNLRVEDAAGGIIGAVGITADRISAISADAEADIAGATVVDIDARLGENDGNARDEGFIQGGDVTFNVSSALLIQNSGMASDFDDRRGILANTVAIASGNAGVAIVINGVIGGLSGLDAIPVATVPGSFDPVSTINGCVIANPASCITPDQTTPTNNPNGNPLRDLIDDQIDADPPVMGGFSSFLIELRQDPEREPDPLIDEPVTGAGNEDLWIGEEENCDDPSRVCPAESEREPAE